MSRDNTLNVHELAVVFPHAYKALPECYQADDCLEFWIEQDILFAKPAPGQEKALGTWRAAYSAGKWHGAL